MHINPAPLAGPTAGLLRLWAASMRFTTQGLSDVLHHLETGRPLIAALWHNELFSVTAYSLSTQLSFAAIVSQSKDGEFLARVLEKLRFRVARGSSSRGGVRALREAAQAMEREKRILVITMDGPRGPRHKAKNGVFYLASRLDAGILPVRAVNNSAYVFKKAWDRFRLPYPFSRCEVRLGSIYSLPAPIKELDLEQEQRKLEARMEEIGPRQGDMSSET